MLRGGIAWQIRQGAWRKVSHSRGYTTELSNVRLDISLRPRGQKRRRGVTLQTFVFLRRQGRTIALESAPNRFSRLLHRLLEAFLVGLPVGALRRAGRAVMVSIMGDPDAESVAM